LSNHVLYDAAIIGGGPAGCAAAIGLAKSGARVLLLERAQALENRPGEILAPVTRMLFGALGLESRLAGLRSHVLAGRLTCWDNARGIEVAGILDPRGGSIVVRRTEFDRWLIDAAQAAGVSVACGVSRLKAERVGTHWHIYYYLENGARSSLVPLVVEACGRGSGILGHGQRRRLDRLIALVAYMPTPAGVRDRRLFVEATKMGWWYGAVLPDCQVVTGFLTEAELVPRGSIARQTWWSANLNATSYIKGLTEIQKEKTVIRGFPAESSIRDRLSGNGWVAIGDAAAAYDPLSGQGIAIALSKGTALARLVTSRTQSSALAEYTEAERDTFARYESEWKSMYSLAAKRFTSPFWAPFRPAI
jgi:flavin-dependent dehydrogenase